MKIEFKNTVSIWRLYYPFEKNMIYIVFFINFLKQILETTL